MFTSNGINRSSFARSSTFKEGIGHVPVLFPVYLFLHTLPRFPFKKFQDVLSNQFIRLVSQEREYGRTDGDDLPGKI